MRLIPLQSGSNGNCLFVETCGVRLLIDAGISGKQAEQRLAHYGEDICDVDALLISHEHSDHVRCMGVLNRKFGLPIHITSTTIGAIRPDRLGKLRNVNHFRAGEHLQFAGVTVETIPTSHDGVDGVGFVIDDGQTRLGILTDLGHCFRGLDKVIASLDGVLLESNFDPGMLSRGDYPEDLKRRIRGHGGHLSNVESARLLAKHGTDRLQWACLGHLSEHNNAPKVVLATHRKALGRRLPLYVASRHRVSKPLEL